MSKNGTKGTRYAIHWETHSKNLLKNFCSLMEHQSLVDIVICCGNNTIQAHKFVLAANSPLFRDEFEKNPSIEQIQIGGCDFSVLKSVVEIMYCGQTIVSEENVKILIAIVKLFQMKNLENLFNEHANSSEEILLPKPQFLTKKPKYPAFTYQIPPPTSQNTTTCIVTNVATSPQCAVVNNPQAAAAAVAMAAHSGSNVLKPINFNISIAEPIPGFKPYGRGKRTLKQQAEQACVKEAQASRMALASLQKEIAAAPQVNSFIIEDTCTETTVENFIPHTEQTPYIQILNYSDVIAENGIQNSMFLPVSVAQNTISVVNTNQGPYNVNVGQNEKRSLTADKLKYMLGGEMPSNVEIMYKDADGNFVPVNEEVLQNLSTKEGLQYQVVDEDGRISEMQELHVIDKIDKLGDSAPHNPISNSEIIDMTKPALEVGDFLKDTESALSIKNGLCSIISKTGEETVIPTPMDTSQPTMEMPMSLEASKPGVRTDIDLKFSPDIFFADIMSSDIQSDVTVIDEGLLPKYEGVPKTENEKK